VFMGCCDSGWGVELSPPNYYWADWQGRGTALDPRKITLPLLLLGLPAPPPVPSLPPQTPAAFHPNP
jgi:hypothetical protein